MSKELLAGIVDERQMNIYAEETKKLQAENAKLNEFARRINRRMKIRSLICLFFGHKWLRLNNNGAFVNNYICIRCAKAKP